MSELSTIDQSPEAIPASGPVELRRLPIQLAVPVYRSYTPETVASMMELAMTVAQDATGPVALFAEFRHRVGARLMDALEHFAESCEMEYLMMIDGDMQFVPEDILRLYEALLEHPEMGAVGGLYRKWAAPHHHLVNWRNEDGTWISREEQKQRVARHKMSPDPIVEVDLFGGGFILCLSSVFKKLEKPYFRSGEDEGGRFGQDTYFAKSLKAAGYKPSIHFGVQVGHVGPRTYYP